MKDRREFNVTQWNARGLHKARLVEFIQFLSVNNPTLVLLSETHWSSSTTPKFKNYFSFNAHRSVNSLHGGVSILLHKSLSCSQIETKFSSQLQLISSECKGILRAKCWGVYRRSLPSNCIVQNDPTRCVKYDGIRCSWRRLRHHSC